jgi:hypothetical protein
MAMELEMVGRRLRNRTLDQLKENTEMILDDNLMKAGFSQLKWFKK